MPTYVLGKGFEDGDNSLITVITTRQITGISTAQAHTGSRSYYIDADAFGGAAVSFPLIGGITRGELWASIWMYSGRNADYNQKAGFILTDGKALVVSPYGGNAAIYIDGTRVLTSTIAWPQNRWFQMFAHLKVSNSAGVFEFRIDGGTLQTFTGNTQPGTGTAISGIYGATAAAQGGLFYLDDLVAADDTWPEDIRFVALIPNGDSSVSWVASTGGAPYTTVDEIPPVDTDYNYSVTNGQQDLYTMTDFDNTGNGGKTPLLVHQVVRAKCETGAGGAVKMILASGATQDVSAAVTLNTGFQGYDRLCPLDPTGAAWTDAALDALLAGVESVL